mmetsp:Transcript_2240/g.3037  ORF Transcript_2240/g.3037 Transcript_2240/m.3037 type:complete len:383 (-) Transcript_2240:196-1344(-)
MAASKIPKIFVAATRQHVGKTTVSLAVISGLKKRFKNVGFIKPVGQQHVTVDGIRVDKDVQLMKEHFDLQCDYKDMSPVIIPKGYTKNYIDGKVTDAEQLKALDSSFEHLASTSDCIVLEGTGHTGVGSVVGLNNARVAARLGAEMVLVCNGGLGSAFDELELNRLMCEREGVRLKGVVLNKVRPDKVEMVTEYFGKLLRRWTDVPLLGVVPDRKFLGYLNLGDIEKIFNTQLLSGAHLRDEHFDVGHLHMICTDLNVFVEKLYGSVHPINPLLVSHCTRTDVILGFLAHYQKRALCKTSSSFRGALILSGTQEKGYAPGDHIKEIARTYEAPLLFAGVSTFKVVDRLRDYTPKLHIHDRERVEAAINHYEPYLDFETMLRP